MKVFLILFCVVLDIFVMSCDVFVGFIELKVLVLVSFFLLIISGIFCFSCVFIFFNFLLKCLIFVCIEKLILGLFLKGIIILIIFYEFIIFIIFCV